MTSAGSSTVRRTLEKARQLTAIELALKAPPSKAEDEPAAVTPPDQRVDDLAMGDDDPRLVATLDLLGSFGGVIFVGPPGTSKTWYAFNIALRLTEANPELVRFVQFHPSYQYEDFVQGFVPTDKGTFELTPKHLMQMCELAEDHPGEWVVLVIDELSRGDPGRIFGEALTYVEYTKRGMNFHLASGSQLAIPQNLVFLATMNPLDRGVDEVDAAFERRFAKIGMDPDPAILEQMLTEAGMNDVLQRRVMTFFQTANGRARANPYSAIGHTFFLGISDEAGLHRLWHHQLRFLFYKAYQLDAEGLTDVERAWDRIFVTASDPAAAGADGTEGGTGADTQPEPPDETR